MLLKKIVVGILLTVCLCPAVTYGQITETPDRIAVLSSSVALPPQFFDRVIKKTSRLDEQMKRTTFSYLGRVEAREQRLRKRLLKLDPNGAKVLFGNMDEQYASMIQSVSQDKGNRDIPLTGNYRPNIDSLKVMLSFLQQHPSLPGVSGKVSQLEASVKGFRQLQGRMEDADQVKEFVRQRREQLLQYVNSKAGLAGSLGKEWHSMNADMYYYSQQVRAYKEMLNSPDEMERKVLGLLNKMPAFQTFMKKNSQLSALFGLPSNYGTSQGIVGLQTKDQVGQLIRERLATGGAGAAASLHGSIQSAQDQLDGYKDKLRQLGQSGGDVDMPEFKPNDQKTKTFLRRLEYGVNFQTTRTNQYFPTVADMGISIGYKLGNSNTAGVGASYKMGLGNGWNHIAFSSQGLGLRSFIDVKIKGSFFISGGFEYNYTTPFTSAQQLRLPSLWTKSGLLGISKSVSMKSRLFKKTKLSLLWDFLSYQQMPRTQAVIFRAGYNF